MQVRAATVHHAAHGCSAIRSGSTEFLPRCGFWMCAWGGVETVLVVFEATSGATGIGNLSKPPPHCPRAFRQSLSGHANIHGVTSVGAWRWTGSPDSLSPWVRTAEHRSENEPRRRQNAPRLSAKRLSKRGRSSLRRNARRAEGRKSAGR